MERFRSTGVPVLLGEFGDGAARASPGNWLLMQPMLPYRGRAPAASAPATQRRPEGGEHRGHPGPRGEGRGAWRAARVHFAARARPRDGTLLRDLAAIFRKCSNPLAPSVSSQRPRPRWPQPLTASTCTDTPPLLSMRLDGRFAVQLQQPSSIRRSGPNSHVRGKWVGRPANRDALRVAMRGEFPRTSRHVEALPLPHTTEPR